MELDNINKENHMNAQSNASPALPTSQSTMSLPASDIESPKAPPSESASSISSISPHYDDKRDVVLRVECLSDTATKRISQIIWAATAAGLALLIAGLALVTTKSKSYWFHTNGIFITNITLASIQILVLGCTLAFFCRRVVRATLTGKRWSRRRIRGAETSAIELILQFINSIVFLIPNTYSLANDCTWFFPLIQWTAFISWTIWNSIFLLFLIQISNLLPIDPEKYHVAPRTTPTGRSEPRIYLDVSWWVHWRKLGLWLCMEGFLLGLTLDMVNNQVPIPEINPGESCKDLHYDCDYSTAGNVLSNLVAAAAIVYLCFYIWYVYSAFKTFYQLPYVPFRMGNLILRLQVRQRGLAFTFFIASIIVYFYVKRASCAAYILSWYGLTPMQLVMTVIAAISGFLNSPKKPEQASILQVWLQEFAWTERDIPRKREERVSSLPEESFEGFCMDCEPLFCFETAIKLMYWSFLAYDTGELPESPFSSATALSLFDLEHFEVVWERALNTKAIIGWREDPATVVIAFRGTANGQNVLADLQVWRTRYPTRDAVPGTLFTRPMVHQGFVKAYTKNNFNNRLLGKVQHILNRCQTAGGVRQDRPVRVLVTGHSLGGALAVLGAYDVATRTPCADYDIDLSCYTFGAPRVGNHTWAKEYDARVTDTWQLINSDDVITRAGKFLFLFKHVGHRVLINRRGDLVVRPSFVEYSIRRSPGGSVTDHYLTSYQRAMVAVVASQFGAKSLGRDKQSVLALTGGSGTGEILTKAGLSIEDVRRLEEGRGEVARQKSSVLADAAMDGRQRVPLSVAARLSAWVRQQADEIASFCFGRHELEQIRVGAEPAAATEGGEGGEGQQSVDGEEQLGSGAQMEARQQAETSLLQFQEMCKRGMFKCERSARQVKAQRTTNKSGGAGGGPPAADSSIRGAR